MNSNLFIYCNTGNEFVCQTFDGIFMAGAGCPAYVRLQPLRRSMAPCSPIMQTFSCAHAPARAQQQRTVQEGWRGGWRPLRSPG